MNRSPTQNRSPAQPITTAALLQNLSAAISQRQERLQASVDSSAETRDLAAENNKLTALLSHQKKYSIKPTWKDAKQHVLDRLDELSYGLQVLSEWRNPYQAEDVFSKQLQLVLEYMQECETAINYCQWYVTQKDKEQSVRQERCKEFKDTYLNYISLEYKEELQIACKKFPQLVKTYNGSIARPILDAMLSRNRPIKIERPAEHTRNDERARLLAHHQANREQEERSTSSCCCMK